MTIRLRIFLFNLISVLLATVVVALIGLKIVESTIIDSTYDKLTLIRVTKTSAIEGYFKSLHVAINMVASHRQTDDLLLSKSTNSIPHFRRILDNYVLDFNIYDLILVDPKGRVVYSTRKDVKDGENILKGSAEHEKLEDLYNWGLSAVEGTTLFIDFNRITSAQPDAMAYLATTVYRDGKHLGVLMLKVSISEIDRLTSDNFSWAVHGLGKTGETLIYGEDWSLRNTGRFAMDTQAQSITDHANRGNEDIKKIENISEIKEIGTDYRGHRVIRSIGKIFLPNGEIWYIQTKIDESEAFAVLERIAIASGAAATLIFILFFFATFAATGKVVEPIQLLIDRFENLGTSNLTQKINYSSQDEIGLLVSKYNQLADRLETTTVSKEFLDSVIQSIKAFLFIVRVSVDQENWDSTYTISQANESAMRLIGVSPENLHETDLKKIIIAQPEFNNYSWLLQTRHSIQAEILNHKGQKIPVLINWAALPNRASKDLTFVFVATDIAERISAERELIEARETAVKASQAKSEFLARMSHEIRTPLNAIIGITDVLAESDLKPDQAKLLKVCANAGENLLALINDILDISKIEAREVKLENIPFNLEATTHNICEILKQKAAEKDLQFTLDIQIDHEKSHVILGDPTRLRQILLNLIGNAIKFTQSGEITVSLRFDDYDSRFVRFCIKDTGTGIPVSKQSQLFQNFVQADSSITRKYGGTGLGLTISKNLVELMGGKIWFKSQEGKGSEFYFTIPFTPVEQIYLESTSAPEVETRSEVANYEETPKHILIVDDTDDNRFLLQTYLKKLPYIVHQASDGQEAIEAVFKNDFDLILMDIQMPVMDGYEATRRIREWETSLGKSPVPIIAVSANAMAEDIQKSMDAGCTEHATTPIKKAAFIDMVNRYTRKT
ncbi:two component sensor histidine kinase [Bdellovibrio bacteriovorus W]|nr:two component sensor histidine kinase [Bdellovibrio bacteriovorus W]